MFKWVEVEKDSLGDIALLNTGFLRLPAPDVGDLGNCIFVLADSGRLITNSFVWKGKENYPLQWSRKYLKQTNLIVFKIKKVLL